MDYIDLYQIHWPDRNVPMFGEIEYDPVRQFSFVPIEEQFDALAKLLMLIRYIGVSNETPYGVMKFILQKIVLATLRYYVCRIHTACSAEHLILEWLSAVIMRAFVLRHPLVASAVFGVTKVMAASRGYQCMQY